MSSSSLCGSSNSRITPLPDLLKLSKPLFSPDKFVELRDMLEDREVAIKMEWENLEKEYRLIKEECRILKRLHKLADLDKKRFHDKMLTSEKECEELEKKITRLSEDEKMSSDRAKKAQQRCVKIREELSKMTTEKNKVICKLNKNVGMLKNQILGRDQSIEMSHLKLMSFEERVAPIQIELQELKGHKSAFDRIMEEMRSKQSEANQMVEELKRQNREKMSYDRTMEEMKREKLVADRVIEQLRRQILGVEMEKTRSDKTIKEMKRKLSEADQTVDELRRSNIELKRQKLDVEEVTEVNTKKLESLSPIITRIKGGLANILNVEVQDMVNITKSNERSDAIPSSKGEKQNLGNSRMHACNGSLKIGSTKLPPQYSPIKEGNANKYNSTDRGKESDRFEGSDCTEVICVEDETRLGGSELSPNLSEKEVRACFGGVSSRRGSRTWTGNIRVRGEARPNGCSGRV